MLLGLQRPAQAGVREGRSHLVAAVPVDNADVVGIYALRAVDDVLQQGAPGERLEHLRQGGIHPLSLARGEDDDAGVQACFTMTMAGDDTAGTLLIYVKNALNGMCFRYG